jgi:ATP-dependent Clp protease ATP-binding subunit ClpA
VQNPWIVRLIIAGLLISLIKFSPFLAWIVILGCLGYAGFLLRRYHETGVLPKQQPPVGPRPVSPPRPPIRSQTIRNPAPSILARNYDPASDLAKYLKDNVYGQPLAADQVSALIWNRLKAGRNEKPLGVFCFAGPPGVGKTHFAKVLNQRLFNDKNTLLHVDMTMYKGPYDVMSLLGGPNQEGLLPVFLTQKPNCIVLLDEFDKAPPEVHARFLTAFSDGFITDASTGSPISTTQAIFILTMNAAADQLVKLLEDHKGDPVALATPARRVLEQHVAPEVVDRIDSVVPFAKLNPTDLGKIVCQELDSLAEDMGTPIAHGGLDVRVIVHIVTTSMIRGMSVRDIKRTLESQFTLGLQDCKNRGAKAVDIREENGTIMVYPC